MPPEYLIIARTVSPHGVRGEVNVQVLSDFPERFKQIKQVFLGPTYLRKVVLHAQQAGRKALFRFEGIDTVEQAETLRGLLVQVPLTEATALTKDEFYWHQIVGLEVEDTAGNKLGRLVDILRTGANDVYVVDPGEGKKEVLIPAIEDVVKQIDLVGERMIVEPLPGLLD